MNRRSFLSLFGSAATVAAVKPTYFFAPVGGWQPSGGLMVPVDISVNVIPHRIKFPSFDEIHAQLVVNWKEGCATLIDPPVGSELDILLRCAASRLHDSYGFIESMTIIPPERRIVA